MSANGRLVGKRAIVTGSGVATQGIVDLYAPQMQSDPRRRCAGTCPR